MNEEPGLKGKKYRVREGIPLRPLETGGARAEVRAEGGKKNHQSAKVRPLGGGEKAMLLDPGVSSKPIVR